MPKKNSTAKKTSSSSETVKRKIQTPKYRSFRLQKRLPKAQVAKPVGALALIKQTASLIARNWKLFLGIVIISALLNALFVQGFFTTDVAATKQNVEATTHGLGGKLLGGLSGLGVLSGAGNDVSTSAYRFILLVIISLAVIWTIRRLLSGEKARIRDGFYVGMYPLVPFILVFLVISLELIPIAIGTYLFSIVGASGGVEIILWSLVLLGLVILTLYMLSSSIFALYIACLPDMQPIAALKSAVQLVRRRRVTVVSRLLALPLLLVIGFGLIMLPVIMWLTPLSAATFFILLMVTLPVVHIYLYLLYRDLLHGYEQ